jgi:predicted O-methyltransferase YrrM
LARRTDDLFSLISATRPADTKVLLDLCRGRHRVVELGTATAWTAITLALDDSQRHVASFDPVERPQRQRYLELVSPEVKARIELITAAGSAGPGDNRPVDLLYIDSSHERDQTIAEVHAWQQYLRPGALVVFDDYANPDYPGVRDGIEALSLEGHHRGKLFIYRHPIA